MNLFKQLNEALQFAGFVKSQKFKSQNFSSNCLPACLYTLIDLPPKLLGSYIASILSQGKVYFRPHEPFLLSCHYLSSLVSRLFCMMASYILAIESCCAPTAVKRTLMPTRVASLLLGASLNTLFATRSTSLLLGASFNTKL